MGAALLCVNWMVELASRLAAVGIPVGEAIREKVYDEYIDRKGELINGSVKRFERGDMIIELGNNLEAIVPKSEQSRGEMWTCGCRFR